MIECWRWFGLCDPIRPVDIAQTGATGVVTALHDIPYGVVWSSEAKLRRQAEVAEGTGLSWQVVESLPVHEDIKRGEGDLPHLFANYHRSLANLAAAGIRTLCYNFMPLIDWTRTDLAAPLPRGGRRCASRRRRRPRSTSTCWPVREPRPTGPRASASAPGSMPPARTSGTH